MSHHESSFESQEEREKTKLVREISNRLNGNGQSWNDLGIELQDKLIPEIALGAIEDLYNKAGYLTDDLKNVYAENIESYYTEEIRGCEQEPILIAEKLKKIENRLSKIGVADEKINALQAHISSWAYTPESA
ncbi:hypothetical protein KC851_02015 [Candidatus Kaiserbacteria bacterium]|nr:hypothetical protein [Candidatus Kaiserbacteria bacterium]